MQGTIEKMKQDKRKADAKHTQDLIDLTAKYEAKGEKDRADMEAKFGSKLAQYKAESDENMKKIMDFLKSQPASTSSTSGTQAQESSNASCRLFKP